MRIRAALLSSCTVVACLALIAFTGGVAQAQTDGMDYNPASQSHWGACSRTTTNVAQAVGDLQANGVLAQYAQLIGVHASAAQLPAQMRKQLTVVPVARPVTTANHGCTDTGLVFGVGPRVLSRGESVGVKLPASVRAHMCTGSHSDCRRTVVTLHIVFPTNCWNLNTGTIPVVVYVHRPKPKPKPTPKPKPKPKPTTSAATAIAQPSATTALSCSAGGVVVTLSNAAAATASADYEVNGKAYGPLAPGQQLQVTIAVSPGDSAVVTVSANGTTLISHRSISNTCATPTPQPAATATMSCSAGGVVVTLSNGASATADASFDVNGASYGPLAPGASQAVTLPLSFGATVQVTVSSGTATLISDQSFTDVCAALPQRSVALYCTYGEESEVVPANQLDGPSYGTLVVVLGDAPGATLPASFTVTVTGNTVAGFGPTTLGPIAPGGSLTEDIPVDGSGSDVTVTITSGGLTIYANTFIRGCEEDEG